MRSIFLFCLIIRASESSSEETTLSNELRSSEFALADAIFDVQTKCDSIVGEAILKTLDKGITNGVLVPDDRYRRCKNTLDEKKREYIATALRGLKYYATEFTMELSNKKLVTLPVPTEEGLSKEVSNFDIQQELCMTNLLCEHIENLKFSAENVEDLMEQKKSVSRCLEFLNDVKLKYIDEKKLKKSEMENEQKMTVVCTAGTVTLSLPEQKKDVENSINSPSISSEVPKMKPDTENEEGNKHSTATKPIEPYDRYNEVVKEFEKGSKDQEFDQRQDSKVLISILRDNEHNAQVETEKEKSITSETSIPQETDLYGIITKDVSTKGVDKALETHENLIAPEEGIASSEVSINVGGDPQKQEQFRYSTSKSEGNSDGTRDTKLETSEYIFNPKEADSQSDAVTNQETEPPKTKSENEGPQDNRIDVSVESKVVKIQASGRLKNTDLGNLPGLLYENLDSKSKDGGEGKSDLFGVFNARKEDNHTKQKRHPESLEDNIVFMENDCKELLQFGEELLKNKVLSSLINLENYYEKCVERLDALKKIYIEKHKLTVMFHKNIFPLTLSSGDVKLIPFPTQFLKEDLLKPQSPSNMTPNDVFEAKELFSNDQSENLTLNIREPFDDPAFIPNDEFLESLQQESAGTSTLSKVAFMLHMNQMNISYTDKENAE